MAAWPVTLALCCLTSVCWSASLVVPVSRAPIQEQKEQQLGPYEIGPAVTEANVSAAGTTTTTTRATTTSTTTTAVIKSRLVPNILSSTISTTSDETLIESTAVSATLNDTEGVAASPTLLPHSTTSSEETTTFRFDAESSAESFESAESTSATGTADLEAPPATKPPSVNTGEPIIQVAGPSSSTGKSVPSLSWPWMVFVLNGNATVATRRQRDLGTYLRLNLAARLDADYNDVAINRILLTPQAILANISVEPSHLVYGGTGAAGLEALGQGNVTLLELSGHEFQVDRIIRFDEIVDQRGVMSSLEMSSLTAAVSSEVTVYGAVGAVFLFLLVALLLGLSFSSPCKAGDNGKYLPSNNLGYDRDQMDNFGDGMAEWKSLSTAATTLTPPVIYTEQLAREMGDGLLTRSHFIPSSRPSPSPTTTTLAELHNQHRCHQEGRQS